MTDAIEPDLVVPLDAVVAAQGEVAAMKAAGMADQIDPIIQAIANAVAIPAEPQLSTSKHPESASDTQVDGADAVVVYVTVDSAKEKEGIFSKFIANRRHRKDYDQDDANRSVFISYVTNDRNARVVEDSNVRAWATKNGYGVSSSKPIEHHVLEKYANGPANR